jgi:hypothetical protein
MERHKTDLIYSLCSASQFVAQDNSGRKWHAAHHKHHHHHEQGTGHFRLVVYTDRMFPTKNFPLVPVQLDRQTPLICIQKMPVRISATDLSWHELRLKLMNTLFRHVTLCIPVEYANLPRIPLRYRSDENRDTNVFQHMANSTRPQGV